MRPANLRIVVRRVDFDYLTALRENRVWHGSGIGFTHFLNALQAVFPVGERFFIEAARDGVERLRRTGLLDPQLGEDHELFVRQEGWHSRQHAKWNEALARTGYPRMRAYEERFRRLHRWMTRNFSTGIRLAMTAAAEHYTACLAHLMISDSSDFAQNMSPPFQSLMLYHAMEEVEHKAVCFDIYRRCSRSYLRRMLGFALTTLDIWVNVYVRNRYLLRADGAWNGGQRRGLRQSYVGPSGVLRVLWPRVKAYLRPSFHPWQWDERDAFERALGGLREKLGIEAFRYR